VKNRKFPRRGDNVKNLTPIRRNQNRREKQKVSEERGYFPAERGKCKERKERGYFPAERG
jgi:hypothetical protein